MYKYSNDEVLMKCNIELDLLEYLLGNLKYDSVIAEEGVHYSGQGQRDIIEADGMEGRLDDSVVNSVGNSNQHTDVLIEEEQAEQRTELLPKEEKAQKPYDFYFNNFFMITCFVANKEQKLDVAEGDILKDIQEVWLEAISITVPVVISRVIVEAEVEKVEESNQQFKYEWTMCSEMQNVKVPKLVENNNKLN